MLRTDPFSSTMNGKAWFAWEWLYDLGLGIIYQGAGLNGVVLLTALWIAVTFTAAFRWMLAEGVSVLLAVLLVLLAISASSIHFLARPHVITWLFALLWFWILDRYEAGIAKAQSLYLLPVLMILWVNLHGGFILAFLLSGIYVLASVLQVYAGDAAARIDARARLKPLCLSTLLSVIASFFNPYGYHLHAHVYSYLTNGFLMSRIDEFQSPNFHGAAQRCFAALLLITVFAVAVRRRKLRISHLLLIAFATDSGLYAARNIPLASIFLIIVVAPLLTSWIVGCSQGIGVSESAQRVCLRMHTFADRVTTMENALRGHLWPIMAIALSISVCLNGGRLGWRTAMNAHFNAKRFPVEAVDLLAHDSLHDPVFSVDSWGGYLIYRLYPQTRVVVDDRHDLYGEGFLKEYLKSIHAEPGWDAPLDRWDVKVILLPVKSPLASVLREDARWRIVHDDGVSIVFRRQ